MLLFNLVILDDYTGLSTQNTAHSLSMNKFLANCNK